MNEGIGGTLILSFIVLFMVFVLSYMAFNVNYTKAFRMKNKVIAQYEKYNGNCTSTCRTEIRKYAQDIGYNPSGRLNCNDYLKAENLVSTTPIDNLYCEYKIKAYKTNNVRSGTSIVDDAGNPYYFKILTRTNITIPIVQNAIPMNVLNSTGDTKVFDLS